MKLAKNEAINSLAKRGECADQKALTPKSGLWPGILTLKFSPSAYLIENENSSLRGELRGELLPKVAHLFKSATLHL